MQSKMWADEVRLRRAERKLTLKALGAQVGCNPRTIAAAEAGEIPGKEVVQRIAAALGISRAWLNDYLPPPSVVRRAAYRERGRADSAVVDAIGHTLHRLVTTSHGLPKLGRKELTCNR